MPGVCERWAHPQSCKMWAWQTEARMDIYRVSQIVPSGSREVHYQEFLRKPSLSAGMYMLPAGARDPQPPHAEDELYYVVSGRATIVVAGESQAVAAGAV